MSRIIQKTFVILFLTLSSLFADQNATLTLGVYAYRSHETTRLMYEPLAHYLEDHLNGYRVVLEVFDTKELEKAVEQHRVDFVLTNPSQYLILRANNTLTGAIATIVTSQGGAATNQVGGVIFTRADRQDIRTFAHFKGQTIAVFSRSALGGYQAPMYELSKAGVDTKKCRFKEIHPDQETIVQDVLNKKVDIGFVRTGLLEELADRGQINLTQLKILNVQHHPHYPYIASTALYPEWPFVVLPHVPADVARKVSALLLSLTNDHPAARAAHIDGFSIPLDYKPVEDVARALRLPPFEQRDDITGQDIWNAYRWPLSVSILFVLTVMGFIAWLARKNQLLQEAQDRTESLLTQLSDEQHLSTTLFTQVEQYKNAIDKVMIVSQTDLSGRIIYANDKFSAISGYTKEELIGQPHNIVRHPSTPKKTFEQMWRKIQSGHIWSGQLVNRRKNGTSYHVKSFVIPLFDERGTMTSYLAIREDVSDLIATQQRLDRERAFVQGILDTTSNIIAIIKDHTLLNLNHRFFELFPFNDFETFIEKHTCICELFLPQEGYLSPSTQMQQWFDPLLTHPEEIHKALMVDRYGETKVYNVTAQQFFFEGERYMIASFNDISSIEHAHQQAQENQRAKADFLASMSHEIRTPMNGILGFLSLLKETSLEPIQQKYLEIIDASTHNLLKTINDILDFSKIESGKFSIDLAITDIHATTLLAFKTLEALASQKSLNYTMTIDTAVPHMLITDPHRIQQILTNLLGNAIKFTSHGGHVTLHVSVEKETSTHMILQFDIIDTGIGIALEKQQKIFEAFTQVDGSTTRQYGGTGLGLAITSRLCTLLGGHITLQSTLTEGSTFSCRIMMAKPATHHTHELNL